MRARLLLAAKITAGLLLLAIAAGAAGLSATTKEGKSFLADFVSRSASSPGMKLDIGAIEGALSANPVVRDISIADRQGVWLKIDHAGMNWSRLALLALKVDIERLEIGAIDVLRKPIASEAKPAKKAAEKSAGGGAPDLPVRVRLGELALERLSLAEPVLGAAATLSAKGSADLGAAKDGARLAFAATRLDAPGDFSVAADIGPNAEKLRLAVTVKEPEGGLIARLAQIPGLPPVEIALDGDGPLDSFEARLSAKAGESVGAEGSVKIAREGAARRLNVNLTGEFSPLLPKSAAALFAGATQISGDGALAGDGGLALERLAVTTSAFKLDASGTLDAERNIDMRAGLHGQPAGEGAAFSAKTLEGEVLMKGSLAQPDATLRLLVEDAQSDAGRFEHFDLDLKALADGPLGGAAAHIDISAQARGNGLAFADRGMAEAIGDGLSLSLRARADGAGETDVGLAKLETGAFEASFAGKAGAKLLEGKANVLAPDLRRFSRLAGHELHGALTLGADLSGAPGEGLIGAVLNGAIASPGAGMAAVDGLLGARLLLTGKVETLPGGGVNFDKLLIRGDHVQAAVEGSAAKDKADVSASFDIPDLRRADPRLAGRAGLSAKLSGSLEKLDAAFEAALSGAKAEGRSIPRLSLTGEAHDLTGALDAKAVLDGTIDGKPARGHVSAAKAGEGWKIDDLDLAIGRAALKGALALGAGGLASGKLALNAPDLDDFSALALQRLAGRLDANMTLDTANGGQNVSITAQGAGIRAKDAGLERLSANISARDLYRRPLFDGEAAVDNAHFGRETIAKARVTARPSGAGAALDFAVDARGFNIVSRAVVTPGERTRIDLSSLSAQRAGKRLALAGPAVITLGAGLVEVKGVSIGAGTGRLDVDGTVGERLDLTAKARAVPLSVAAIADSALNIDGVLDAEARITGTKAAPAGDWRIKLARLTAPQLRANGLPAIDIAANGRLAGQRTTLDADIALGGASRVKAAGSAPIDPAGGLDLAIKGMLDAALANSMLAANGQTVSGKADVDMRVTGPPSAPILAGGVTLAGGTFNDPLNGVALNSISGKIEGHGRELSIPGLVALTKNGGQLAVSGKVSVAPEAGMPGAIRIVGKNALLASTDIVSSTADLDLNISGPLARAPKISGKVNLVAMEVSVPDRIPANLKALPNSNHIDAKGFAAQMLAVERKEKEKAGKKSNFDAFLDLAISAPNRIFVRGRGIDAEFSGDLKLTGSIQKPTAIGAFDLRRGKLQLLTQRIDITRGKLAFAGGLTPQLDFAAETQAAEVTARIGITGPASMPMFSFSSSPELPQDEVLSRLLFAKASGSLTPFQAVQLAAALAQFSGAATGVDAFEKMRKALGVDSLDIDAGGSGGPTVGASRYIMDGVSVGVRAGSKPEQAAINAGVDVTKKVRVQGETRMDGKTSVGVGVEWEY